MSARHALLLALAAAPLMAGAQPMLGRAENGLALARDVCAECHAVERDPKVMSAYEARSFAAIAGDPKFTEAGFRVFLQTPHQQMPDLVLTTGQIDDLIAYLASFESP